MRNGDVDWKDDLLLLSDWKSSSAVAGPQEILNHYGLLSGLPEGFDRADLIQVVCFVFFMLVIFSKTELNIVHQYSSPECYALARQVHSLLVWALKGMNPLDWSELISLLQKHFEMNHFEEEVSFYFFNDLLLHSFSMTYNFKMSFHSYYNIMRSTVKSFIQSNTFLT